MRVVLISWVLYLHIFCLISNALPNDKVLRFSADGTFKIAQFTDVHYGEGESEAWGPEQDRQSTSCMREILKLEGPIDLAIFSGDLITGNNIYDNATAYWSNMLTAVNESSTKFATLFGNHDDAPLESLKFNLRSQNIISKQELQRKFSIHLKIHTLQFIIIYLIDQNMSPPHIPLYRILKPALTRYTE